MEEENREYWEKMGRLAVQISEIWSRTVAEWEKKLREVLKYYNQLTDLQYEEKIKEINGIE